MFAPILFRFLTINIIQAPFRVHAAAFANKPNKITEFIFFSEHEEKNRDQHEKFFWNFILLFSHPTCLFTLFILISFYYIQQQSRGIENERTKRTEKGIVRRHIHNPFKWNIKYKKWMYNFPSFHFIHFVYIFLSTLLATRFLSGCHAFFYTKKNIVDINFCAKRNTRQ